MSTNLVTFNICYEKFKHQMTMKMPADFTEFTENIVSVFFYILNISFIFILTIEITMMLKM